MAAIGDNVCVCVRCDVLMAMHAITTVCYVTPFEVNVPLRFSAMKLEFIDCSYVFRWHPNLSTPFSTFTQGYQFLNSVSVSFVNS